MSHTRHHATVSAGAAITALLYLLPATQADESTLRVVVFGGHPDDPESAADLSCAPDGQVRNLSGAETVYSLNRATMDELRATRVARRSQLSPDVYREFIRDGVLKTTGYEPTRRPLGVHRVWATNGDAGTSTATIILEYEAGFSVRADLHDHQNPSESLAVVLIGHDNETGRKYARGLHSRGFHVLHLHTSETKDRAAIMSGKPRCSRWMKLLVCGADYFTRQATTRPSPRVVAVGIGPAAALSARFAGLVEPGSFAGVAALHGLDRLESLATEIKATHSLQILPGSLRYFDETDLAAAMGSGPLLLAGTQDKHGEYLWRNQMRQRQQWTRSRHAHIRQPLALRLAPGECNVTRLAEWLATLASAKK